MSRQLLTIAFPTYNRGGSIRRAIRSVIAGTVGANPAEYEIVIQDNASTDDTPERVQEIMRENPDVPLRYTRNDANLGYDGNHLLLYRKAVGEYVWFCSDRYYYAVDVSLLLHIIKQHRPSAITFSNMFRAVWRPAHDSDLRYVDDDWLAERLKAERHQHRGRPYLLSTVATIQASGCLRRGVPAANVSDCVIRRETDPASIELLASYNNTYMLPPVALLLAFRRAADMVATVQVPWFASAFEKQNFGGYRHDSLSALNANIRLATDLPFLGDREHILRMHLRNWVLLTLRLRASMNYVSMPTRTLSRMQVRECFRAAGVQATWRDQCLICLAPLPWPRGLLRLALRAKEQLRPWVDAFLGPLQ